MPIDHQARPPLLVTAMPDLIEAELAEQRLRNRDRLFQPYTPRSEDLYPVGPTVNIGDIRHRRFPLIERTLSRAQVAAQRILGGLLARVRPKPQKPPEGPPRTRYERLRSDLPEL